MSLSYLDVSIDTESRLIKTTFDFNPKMFNGLNQPFHRTLGRSFWKVGNLNCQWRNISTQVNEADQVRVSADSICPGTKSDFNYDLKFLSGTNPSLRIVARIIVDGEESTFLFSRRNREIKLKQKIDYFGNLVTVGKEMFPVKITQALDLNLLLLFFLFIPILILLKKYSANYQQFVKSSAIGIMLIGGYWFFERIFF